MARVIAICNQKGGVGKTTTAVNLGTYLAASGRRVLLIDLDPQGNASSGLGHNMLGGHPTIYDGLMNGREPEHLVRSAPILNYELIPAGPQLAGALIELVDVPDREFQVRKLVNRLRHTYDYVLIDLPPSLGLLTVNGLIAADEVVVPVQAEYYSVEGLSQLLETIRLIQNNLRHNLAVAGAVITFYDKRERLSREVAKNVRRNFPHHVFDVEIPRSVALAEAPSFGKPIFLYSPFSPGANAYRRLAQEIIAQEKRPAAIAAFGNFNVI